MLPPRKTLAQAGVADGAWLVAVTLSPGECGQTDVSIQSSITSGRQCAAHTAVR